MRRRIRSTARCRLEEKPPPTSNYAVTFLYFYDVRASDFARPETSPACELDITDLNRCYLDDDSLAWRSSVGTRVARYRHARIPAAGEQLLETSTAQGCVLLSG